MRPTAGWCGTRIHARTVVPSLDLQKDVGPRLPSVTWRGRASIGPSGVGAQSKNGMGWWYGFKLHVQCDEAGCLCGFDLTTATVDDRKLLNPLTR